MHAHMLALIFVHVYECMLAFFLSPHSFYPPVRLYVLIYLGVLFGLIE